MNDMPSKLNDLVRNYWEKEPCGTHKRAVGELPKETREWFEQVEEYRYRREPFIHSVAQFTRWHGKKILEIGVGAGTDHLQFARAGAECYGVDLTDAAIDTTRTRLTLYGFTSHLQRVDAEELPFESESFDLVYSWGVIHHSEHPERIIREIKRVLKPEGVFIGMMYNRRSLFIFYCWIKYALLKGKPWRSFTEVTWNHMESIGTKAYTIPEVCELFSEFSNITADPMLTLSERSNWPAWLSQYFPDAWGGFIKLKAYKSDC